MRKFSNCTLEQQQLTLRLHLDEIKNVSLLVLPACIRVYLQLTG